MNREQIVEKVWQSITAHNLDEWAAAEEIVDLLLPQVSTVAELEALPVGAALVDAESHFWLHEIERPRWWSPSRERGWPTVDVVEVGPLTVVWQPE